MEYISTRGGVSGLSFREAVATGLASDGGLILPAALPQIADKLSAWEPLSYADLCLEFFKLFATDMPAASLQACIADAYSRFRDSDITPLKRLDEDLFVLELFHGPTLAFKDLALQLLGNLYEEQIKLSNEFITVLGATSGDTGAAAIHGLLGKQGVHIFILYPNGRVSALQERQMTCTGAENVYALAVDGSFDDAQRALKETFEDTAFKAQYHLSAVNSINLARILAQCVYYLFAWFRLPEEKRKNLEFVVPTGNFGNVLAGWLVQKMGLPVSSFRVATNQNDILYRLFKTGIYEVGAVQPSLAPSMDIQVSSNFERFLYYAEKGDTDRVRSIMETFKATGHYTFENFDRDTFTASRMDDGEITQVIGQIKTRYDYIVDPHTACGFKDLDREKTSVVLSTAHPAKFPEAIEEATGEVPTAETLEALKEKTVVKYPLKPTKEAIQGFIRERVNCPN